MLRQVRGLGTLVPEDHVDSAQTIGRVDQIVVRPGAIVQPDTVLIKMSNPSWNSPPSAEWRVKAAEATTDLKVKLESGRLDQEVILLQVASEYAQAKLNADVEAKLGEQGLTSDVKVQTTKGVADELLNRSKIERQKADISKDHSGAACRAGGEHRKASRGMGAEEEAARHASGARRCAWCSPDAWRYPATPIEVQPSKWPPVQILAKVAQQSNQKAELKIAETQAKDILIGQVAQIDTRNGVIDGKVSRIDPAVQNGTVTVDVRLIGELPNGARPDLSVDGTIELERLDDVGM